MRTGAAHTLACPPRGNVKPAGVVERYAQALARRPAFCSICSLLKQDYDCLGYERPAECGACVVERRRAPPVVMRER